MSEKNTGDMIERITDAMTVDMAGEPIWCESAGDFTLPDYMPAIAKMQNTEARVIASGRYIGSDKAEFSGSVVYSMIYTGEDGVPFFTNLTSDYEYSVPLGECATSDGIRIYEEPTVESVTVRPSGPRRVSVRARIKTVPHIMVEKDRGFADAHSELDAFTEKLCEVRDVMSCVHFESGEFELEEEFRIDASMDAEPVGCETNVCISDVRASVDGIICKGEVEYRVLYFDIEGGRRSLFTYKNKLRFEKEIYTPHVPDILDARAYGVTVSSDITKREGEEAVSLLVVINICGEYMYEKKEVFVKDMFCTGLGCEVGYENTEYSRAVLCRNANFSFHGQKQLSDEEIAFGDVCVCFGNARVDNVSVSDKRAQISGDISIDCIVKAPMEERVVYSTENVILPFKCEMPVMCETERYDARVMCEVCGIRARIEDGMISADAELYLSASIIGKESLNTVKSLVPTQDDRRREDDSLLIYYPDKNESLWSVAKKYGVCVKTLAQANGIDPSSPDSEESLSGLHSVIIR